MGDNARPKDDGELPRGAYAFRDRIVRAATKQEFSSILLVVRFESNDDGGKGKAANKRKNAKDRLDPGRTFTIRSRASADTFDGIRRSTFAIRLYVAARSDQRDPVSTRAPVI